MARPRYERRDGIEIEGATPEQREALELVLAGMSGARIEALLVCDFDLSEGATGPVGTELRVTCPEADDARLQWEATLVGRAFRDVSVDRGLPRVVWVSAAGSGTTLAEPEVRAPAPAASEVERQVLAAAATTGAYPERVELLQPLGVAVAVTLTVAEPHAFLRHGLKAFKELSGHFDFGRDGSFVELRDGGDDAVYAAGVARGYGIGSVRSDVRCCAPIRRGGLEDPGPPPCPVLGLTAR